MGQRELVELLKKEGKPLEIKEIMDSLQVSRDTLKKIINRSKYSKLIEEDIDFDTETCRVIKLIKLRGS